MASRVLPRFSTFSVRTSPIAMRASVRSFQSSSRYLQEVATAIPVRKPVGAFRGGSVQLSVHVEGLSRYFRAQSRVCCRALVLISCALCSLFGFLLGSTLAGASVYYYILEEYKVSNEMLTEDIYVRASLLYQHSKARALDIRHERSRTHAMAMTVADWSCG